MSRKQRVKPDKTDTAEHLEEHTPSLDTVSEPADVAEVAEGLSEVEVTSESEEKNFVDQPTPASIEQKEDEPESDPEPFYELADDVSIDEISAYDISPTALGKRGEKAARLFLQRHGMKILDTNWRAPVGEIDIVAFDGEVLRFIEVKTRISEGHGFPEEHVTKERRKKYEILAEYYLRDYEDGRADTQVTFDVISMLVTGPYRAFLRYHRNVMLEDCS